MKESQQARAARTKTIIQRLKRYYPDAHCALVHANAFELLVATILSAQCTDERVNKVTPALFKRFPDARALKDADSNELETLIKSAGFFRAKARSLKGMADGLVRNHGGEVPEDFAALVELPGVGRKTANVVMGNAFGVASGVVVDTHVRRISQRLGLTKSKEPEKIEAELNELIAKKDWIFFPHGMIFHGRKICKARSPACEKCVLEGECPKVGVVKKK